MMHGGTGPESSGRGAASPAPDAGPHAGAGQNRQESRRQLAVAFDSAPIGMAVTSETGQLVQVNESLAELLGYRREHLLGRLLEDFAAPDAAAAIRSGRAQMLEAGQARHTTGGQLRHAAGHDVEVSLTCARVRAVPGAPDSAGYLVVHVQDVRERRETEAELLRRALHDR